MGYFGRPVLGRWNGAEFYVEILDGQGEYNETKCTYR